MGLAVVAVSLGILFSVSADEPSADGFVGQTEVRVSDTDGDSQVEIGVTNISNNPISVTAVMEACALGPIKDGLVAPGSASTITVPLLDDCEIPDSGTAMIVSIGDTTVEITVKPPEDLTNDWWPLLAFPVVGLVTFVALWFVAWKRGPMRDEKQAASEAFVVARDAALKAARSSAPVSLSNELADITVNLTIDHYIAQDGTSASHRARVPGNLDIDSSTRSVLEALIDPKPVRKAVRRAVNAGKALAGASEGKMVRATVPKVLGGLPSTWDFKESYVTTATIIGTLLTGLFATSAPIEAVFGEDDPNLGLFVVGAAIAVVLLAASPIILTVTKSGKSFTRDGLIGATSVATAAAAGELFVVSYSGSQIDDSGWWALANWLGFALAMGLLGAYALVTFKATISDALKLPTPALVDPAVAAAVYTAAAGQNPPATPTDAYELWLTVKQTLDSEYPALQYGRTAPGDDASGVVRFGF